MHSPIDNDTSWDKDDDYAPMIKDDNMDDNGNNKTASPRTINMINAECTGKGSHYATFPTIIIRVLVIEYCSSMLTTFVSGNE